MKNIYVLGLLLFLNLGMVSCAQSSKSNDTAANGSAITLITPQELNQANQSEIVLVDVRTPQEYAQGHIENAINIDFYAPDFLKKMNALDKNKDIYIYCRSGHRSGLAAKKLEQSGFKKIYDLQGGINNWYTKNLKVVR